MSGKLIVIEGVDGVGKQTQAQLLQAYLNMQGVSSATIDFPRYGKTDGAKRVEAHLQKKALLSTEELAMAFAADRFASKPYLQALLATNDFVIADRYVYSNVAYQVAKTPEGSRAAMFDLLGRVEFRLSRMPVPDCVVFLTVNNSPLDWAMLADRLAVRGNKDVHEAAMDLLKEANSQYFEIASYIAERSAVHEEAGTQSHLVYAMQDRADVAKSVAACVAATFGLSS